MENENGEILPDPSEAYVLIGQTPVRARSMDEWVDCLCDIDSRRVGLTEIGGVLISTVFTGIPAPSLLPEIYLFESIARNAQGQTLGCYATRTWLEAEALHRIMVEVICTEVAKYLLPKENL